MSELESQSDFEFYEDGEVAGTTRLKEGLLLKELVNEFATEFSLDASGGGDQEKESEMRVETCYDYQDFEPYINLDCIQIDPNDANPNASPFDKFHKKMTNVTEDGGVKKLVIKPGVGEVVPENAVVYVHYSSYLEMEEVPFDTTYLRSNKPSRIQLGSGSVYPGFEIAVSTMKKNEQSQFLVVPNYAFGKMGAPPRIPPNSTILLVIDLLNFVNCGDSINVKNLNSEEKKKFPEAYKAAKSFHALGNDYFSHKNVSAAVENYKKAEALLTGCYLSNDEEEADQKKLLLKLYVNLSICYNDPKLRMPEKACIAAKDAHFAFPKGARQNAKLQYNWGKALLTLGEFDRAGEHFKQALAIEPNNSDICEQLKILEEKKKRYYEHEKISYKKALGLGQGQQKEELRKQVIPVVKEVTDEFEEAVRQQLNEFLAGPSNRIQLTAGLTEEERKVCRVVAEELQLRYQEEVVSGNVTVSIVK